MKSRSYFLAGWLAILLAVILFPTVAGGVLIDLFVSESVLGKMLNIVLSFLTGGLGVYLLWMFKKLLNSRFEFFEADRVLVILIWFHIFFLYIGLSDFVVISNHVLRIISIIFGAMVFIAFGILNILLGVKILKSKDDLFGLQKPYAYLQITAGVLLLSVLLSPIGLLAATAAYIVQGILFLRAAEDLQFV